MEIVFIFSFSNLIDFFKTTPFNLRASVFYKNAQTINFVLQ